MAKDRVGEQLALGFSSHFSYAFCTLTSQACTRLRPPFCMGLIVFISHKCHFDLL